MQVLVGSKNSVKLYATRSGFNQIYSNTEVIGLDVPSSVPSQPINEETFDGAKNRAIRLAEIDKDKQLGADYFAGIEGGIMRLYSSWYAFGACCIIDSKGRMGLGTSPYFPLPESVSTPVLNGRELGEVMDEIFNQTNSKKSVGAIGILTQGAIERKDLYTPAVICALIPFLNEKLYF